MGKMLPTVGRHVFLPKTGLADLVSLLISQGYTVLAPVQSDGVIALRPIQGAADVARGVQDRQEPGRYRLVEGDEELYFQYVVGADGPKRYFVPPVYTLFQLHVEKDGFVLDSGPPQPPKLAMLGIRPCELAAIKVQDRVFHAGDTTTPRCELDGFYMQAREMAMLIVVNCTHPAGTCFCRSMGTGPKAAEGFDLALTELRAGFLVEIGSPRGAELAQALPVREPSSTEMELAELRLEQSAERMGREMDTAGLPELMKRSLEHAHWDEIARKCLGCGNCTMVCPTCFCSSISDDSDLKGGGVSRTRKWDCCYTHQYSYTTAGPVRSSIRARHRQWLTHKLGTWWEQFGCSGCVGCGRCITWCPVGIDLTAEVRALRGDGRGDGSGVPVARRMESEVAP
jgi:ferredoxin